MGRGKRQRVLARGEVCGVSKDTDTSSTDRTRKAEPTNERHTYLSIQRQTEQTVHLKSQQPSSGGLSKRLSDPLEARKGRKRPNLVTPCAAGSYPATLCQSQADTRKGLPSTRGYPSSLAACQGDSERGWMRCCPSVQRTRSGMGMTQGQPIMWKSGTLWTSLAFSCRAVGVNRHRQPSGPPIFGVIERRQLVNGDS